MEVVEGLPVRPLKPSAIAIGNFDGCHLGHRSLFSLLVAEAKARGVQSVALTFYPHPAEVLRPHTPLERLMTLDEKLKALGSTGIDVAVVLPFNKQLASVSASDFFRKTLVHDLSLRALHVGFDFRFGRDREGDVKTLEKECKSHGVSLTVHEPYIFEGEKVSSSRIRALIKSGDVRMAARLLARNPGVAGTVTHGSHRGTGLGFPTANLDYPVEKLLPRFGVYATWASVHGKHLASVTNVGVRPTFEEKSARPFVEVHLLSDGGSSLYGEHLGVEFVERIREERKFASADELKSQIASDALRAKEILAECV